MHLVAKPWFNCAASGQEQPLAAAERAAAKRQAAELKAKAPAVKTDRKAVATPPAADAPPPAEVKHGASALGIAAHEGHASCRIVHALGDEA